MSLEEMEWSISIAELEEALECGDVIYLIVMVYSRVFTSTLALPLQVFTVFATLYFPKPKNRTIEISNNLLHSGLRG